MVTPLAKKRKKLAVSRPLKQRIQITFAGSVNYLKRVDDTRARAIFVPTGFEAPGKNLIGVSNPQLAFAGVVALFHPTLPPPSGISK